MEVANAAAVCLVSQYFKVDSTHMHARALSRFSRFQLFMTLWTVAHQVPLSLRFSSKNTGVGCHILLQGIFLTQGSNPSPLHWQAGSLPLAPPGKTVYTIV